MKRLFSLIFITILTVILALSCEKNTSVAGEDDESVVTEMAQAEDEDYLFDEGINDVSDENMYNGYSSFGSITSPIDTVFRLGRKMLERPRRVVTDIRRIGPDSIKVFVGREFVGRFIIIEKEDDSTFVRHVKPLRHVVRRCAIYVKRNPNDQNIRRRWKLASVSLGKGNSLPTGTIQINEVSVSSSGGVSVVYTDPLHTLLEVPDDILFFAPGEEVTVQVKLTNSTPNPVDPLGNGATETVLLHYGTNRHHHARKQFEYVGADPVSGEQVYEGTWTIRQEPFRVYHAVVDAIDNGTIYDDSNSTYPYNSATWSAPYRVGE
jgi:hypothetical protein